MLAGALKNHKVWRKISEVEAQLAAFGDTQKLDERFADLSKKIEYLRWILESSDSAFISEQDLEQTAGELAQVQKFLPSDANNFEYFENISNQFAVTFARFPYPRLKKIFRSEANDAIDEISALVG